MKRVLGLTLASLLPIAGVLVHTPAEARPHRQTGIVYVSDRDSPAANQAVDDVYLLTPSNRRVYRMTEDGGGGERYPTLSPDGRWLAYVRFVVDANDQVIPDRTALYRCRVRHQHGAYSCSSERRVVGPVAVQPIAWTPDSRSLVYSGMPNASDGDVDLYLVRARDEFSRNLTSEPADGIFVQNSQPSVSPDGRWVYYSRGSVGGADLYRRSLDGPGLQQLTAAPNNDVGVDVSPDGRRLVFHSNREGDGANFDIYTMRAAAEGPGNPAVNLTRSLTAPSGASSQERRPSWSPDGQQIAFMWFTDPVGGFCFGCTDGEVYSIRADGSHVRNLTANNPIADEQPETPLFADITPDWGRLPRS